MRLVIAQRSEGERRSFCCATNHNEESERSRKRNLSDAFDRSGSLKKCWRLSGQKDVEIARRPVQAGIPRRSKMRRFERFKTEGLRMTPYSLLRHLFDAAVAAADPYARIAATLPEPPAGRTIVIGAGKGSALMAEAFLRAWSNAGLKVDAGLVVTSYGSEVDCGAIQIVGASHPVPDAASQTAAEDMLTLASEARADDLVVALISGGGSALLSLPPDNVGAEAKRELNRQLLACGASIHEMNAVRKHFSLVKGGHLAAAAHPARVVTYVVSDIPGDDVTLVASGPTLPSEATRKDAEAIVRRYQLDLPPALAAHLSSAAADAPRPEDPAYTHDSTVVLATARQSLEAAKVAAEELGYRTVILSDQIEGEARDIGRMHGALARETLQHGLFARPVLLLSGGETTVTLRAKGGRGGRNSEFLAGFAEAIDGLDGVYGLAADTDGIDGSERNAGAFCNGESAGRLRERGTPLAGFLAANDAYSAFEALGDLLETGPTGTNVNDFRAILIE